MFFLLPSSVSQRLNPTLERAGGLWLFLFSFFFFFLDQLVGLGGAK